MANKSDFSVENLEKLPSLPLQSSPTQPGQYVVRSPKADAYQSPDNQFNSKIWYTSPALNCTTIQHLTKIQLFAESHDQGYADDPLGGNWTWFELAILEDEGSTTPRQKDGIELIWRSHENRFLNKDFGWEEGTEFGQKHDMLRLLEPGNVIAVRLCARFTGWIIAAREGLLVFDIGSAVISRDPVEYATIVKQVKAVQTTLVQVNNHIGAAFSPQPSAQIFRADSFGTGDEKPLRVLSLDGGGVRGLASLQLLEAVMEKAAPGKKPCEVFDMIGGTSTGGLIAIMLGRLRMTIKETSDEYKAFMGKVFNKNEILKDLSLIWKGDRYDSSILQGVIKDIVKKKLGSDEVTLLETDPQAKPSCKVFCMAVQEDAANNRGPVFLRSYINDKHKSLIPDIKIWEAARATSAAPSYFAPMVVGKYKLIDGGLGANNPLGWLWTEILDVFGPARSTNCFLSIGTGIPPNTPIKSNNGFQLVFSSLTALSSVATNSQIIHVLFRTLIDAYAPKPLVSKYFRLNIGESTGTLEQDKRELNNYKEVGEMDDTNALKRLLKTTEGYIKNQEGMISDCAKALA